MTLNYSVPGQVSIDMSHYVEKMVKEFPQENLKGTSVASPWNENLFKVQHNSAPLEMAIPHHDHARTVSLQAWLSIYCTSNSLPNYTGTKTKSCRLDQVMSNDMILKQTVKDKLTLRADDSGCLSWHCNTAFALHGDFRSHTGSSFLMGDGAITSLSRKQGMNTRSSTEVEVVAADEIVSPMIWTQLFLKA